MLTPIEIHNKELKTGRGYSKKEMDEFLDEILESYEALYKENMELKEKLTKLSDGVQYYKTMETTLQKALVLAEKTSRDTIETANSKAGLIEKEASIKAEQIVNKAYTRCDQVRQQCISLIQQYNQFKMQFKQIAIKQIDLLESDFYEIYSNELNKKLDETIDCIPSAHKDSTSPVQTAVQAEDKTPASPAAEAETVVRHKETDTPKTTVVTSINNDKEVNSVNILSDDTKEFRPEDLVHPEQTFNFEFLDNDEEE